MSFLKKKKLSILFLLVLLFQAVVAPMALAEEAPVDKPIIVSLGDSITYGSNLQDRTKAFPYLLGNGYFQIENLGVPGLTSKQLLDSFDPQVADSIAEKVKNASIITITIGSNDLLAPAWPVIRGGAPITDPVQQELLKTAISQAALQLGNNLASIYGKIRELNPQAPILLSNIYNPFADVGEKGSFEWYLHNLGEEVVTSVNSLVMANFGALDAYSAFNGKQVDYIIPGDIHPTEAGHHHLAAIANAAIKSYLEQQVQFNPVPSNTEETEGPVIVTVETNSPEIISMKWLAGVKKVADFQNDGTVFEANFEVSENGTYTVYVKTALGFEKVRTIDVENIVPPAEEPPVEEPPIEEPPVEEPPVNEEPKVEDPKEDPKKEPVKDEQKVKSEKTETKSGNKLPETASPLYNMLAIGMTTLLIGSALLFMYVRKNRTA